MSDIVSRMREHLLPLDDVYRALDRNEPATTIPLSLGDDVLFIFDPGWNHGISTKQPGDTVGGHLHLGKVGYALTVFAVERCAAAIGLPARYALSCPSILIERNLNHFWRNATERKQFQLVVAGTTAVSLSKDHGLAYSTKSLVDSSVCALRKHFGTQTVLVDFKFHHSVARTDVRLLLPDITRTLATGHDNDLWSYGIDIHSSIGGQSMPTISGYLFRWESAGGVVLDQKATMPASVQTDAGLREWASSTTLDAIKQLDPALDTIEHTADIPFDDPLSNTMRALFREAGIAASYRTMILDNLVDVCGALTWYEILNAVSLAANSVKSATAEDALLRAAWRIPHSAAQRCESCHQLT